MSTAPIVPCSDLFFQTQSPSSVGTLTNSQLHHSIQYLNVSIFVIFTPILRPFPPHTWIGHPLAVNPACAFHSEGML